MKICKAGHIIIRIAIDRNMTTKPCPCQIMRIPHFLERITNMLEYGAHDTCKVMQEEPSNMIGEIQRQVPALPY